MAYPVKVNWPEPKNVKRPGAWKEEGRSKTRLQIFPWVSATGRSRLKIVQMSLGVTFAISVAAKLFLGRLELMGTRTEVEMEPFGSLPSGCAGLEGHCWEGFLWLKKRSSVAPRHAAGAARAVERKAIVRMRSFMLNECYVRCGLSEQ